MSLVGCDLLGVNAFLVARGEADSRFRAPFTAEHHYETPKYHLTSHVGHPPSRKPRRWVVRKGKETSDVVALKDVRQAEPRQSRS